MALAGALQLDAQDQTVTGNLTATGNLTVGGTGTSAFSGSILVSGGSAPTSATSGSNIFTAGIATSGPFYAAGTAHFSLAGAALAIDSPNGWIQGPAGGNLNLYAQGGGEVVLGPNGGTA